MGLALGVQGLLARGEGALRGLDVLLGLGVGLLQFANARIQHLHAGKQRVEVAGVRELKHLSPGRDVALGLPRLAEDPHQPAPGLVRMPGRCDHGL